MNQADLLSRAICKIKIGPGPKWIKIIKFVDFVVHF